MKPKKNAGLVAQKEQRKSASAVKPRSRATKDVRLVPVSSGRKAGKLPSSKTNTRGKSHRSNVGLKDSPAMPAADLSPDLEAEAAALLVDLQTERMPEVPAAPPGPDTEPEAIRAADPEAPPAGGGPGSGSEAEMFAAIAGGMALTPGLPDREAVKRHWYYYSRAASSMTPLVKSISEDEAAFLADASMPILVKLSGFLDHWLAQYGGLLLAVAMVYGPHALAVWGERAKPEDSNTGAGGKR